MSLYGREIDECEMEDYRQQEREYQARRRAQSRVCYGDACAGCAKCEPDEPDDEQDDDE